MVSAIAPPPAEALRPGRARRISGLIWGFCLLLVIGIWWFVIGQVRFEHDQAVDDAVRQNSNRTIAFEQYVRRTLEAADLVTRYVGGRFARGNVGPEFVGRPGRPVLISGNVAQTGTFLAVSIANADGEIVATSVTAPMARPNVANHPAFRVHVARDTGQLYISPPFHSRLAGRPLIWLTRRLNNPDGSFAGVIAINFPPEQFVAFFRDAQVRPQDMMAVIGLDGIIRSSLHDGETTSGRNVAGTQVMTNQQREPNGTFLTPSVIDGRVRFFSHRRLRDFPLFVTYGVLEADVLAVPRHRATIFYVGAGLVSLMLVAFALVVTLSFRRRERREAELARANERLSEAQRIGQIGDWEYDLGTGETFWSPQLCRQFERTPEQGSPTFDEFRAYLTEEGRETIDRAHAEAVRTGKAQEIEYEVHLPSGKETRHQGVVMPSFDAAGRVVRLHGTDQNISARKLLDRLQTQVAHLSRLEAMNAMAATLAHELNQPLTAASNYLNGSRRRLKKGGETALEDVGEGLEAAEQQVHLAADILRRVREMVANQPRTVTNVALARVVEDALALVSIAGGAARPAVSTSFAADARSVRADRIQVQQVLINLLGNAFEATKGRDDAAILIGSRRDGDYVAITITDNGTGFARPADERFSPFATTRESGLGLGLSISRTIIESHGGRIWTEDREGGGAVVGFTLPSPRARRPRTEPKRDA
ncbi:MAG TPA: ATP-binding protein [Allosphingosinicella sp.]|nr:ATP-binding protein [Allosphingosinicella sp.]